MLHTLHSIGETKIKQTIECTEKSSLMRMPVLLTVEGIYNKKSGSALFLHGLLRFALDKI
jgi:hypothetical protein